ncbi:MAG: hypothetical protein IJI52_06540 [Solobacterium sp.]|nr:hypothetical protein [Solobacterium sp.]
MMKNKKTANIVKILLKSILACALFVCVWFVLTPYFRVDHNDDGDMFRNLDDNCIDVLALGSSHIQYAFDPGVYYAETGLYSYVMGSSCQPMETTYYMLKEVLKTQHPSVVIIDTFTLLPQSSVCYADGMFYKAIDMMEGANRIQAGLDVPVDEVKTVYAFDLIMNHSNWKDMALSDLKEIMEGAKPTTEINWIGGYVRQEPDNFNPVPLDTYTVNDEVSLSDEEQHELNRIIELCRKENIYLLFTKTPYAIDQGSTNKLAAVWKFLDEKGIDYVDYTRKAAELGWYMNLHGDSWHNNAWGAEIVTRDLAALTAEHVHDHQDNALMNDIMASTEWMSTRSLFMDTNLDVCRMLDNASKYPTVVLVRYHGTPATVITEKENRLLQNLGIRHDFVNDCDADYYAMVVDGQVAEASSEPLTVTWNDVAYTLNKKEILRDGAVWFGSHGNMDIFFMDHPVSVTSGIQMDTTAEFWPSHCDGWSCSY